MPSHHTAPRTFPTRALLPTIALLMSMALWGCAGAPAPQQDAKPQVTDLSNSAPATAQPTDEAIFADFALQMSAAITARAQDKAHDPIWDNPDLEPDITRGDLRGEVDAPDGLWPLDEGWTHAMTYMELGAVLPDSGGVNIKFGVAVFPDGRVRWGEVRVSKSRADESVDERKIPGLEALIRATTTRMLSGCALDPLLGADMAAMPPNRFTESFPPKEEMYASFAKPCEDLQTHPVGQPWALGWTEDLVVFMAKGDQVLVVESWIEGTVEGKPTLRALSIEPMP